ncbi:MAG: mycothione reductase [Acidimicrobiales bacterium]
MRHHDLIILGAGSGNTLLSPDFDDVDVAIIERDTFGGTCLNRGCIPSKMFVYAADVAETVRHGHALGVDAAVTGVRWRDIVDRVFGRIDPIAQGGEDYRRRLDNVTVYPGDAHFVAERVLEVDGERLTAPDVVIAAGARPFVPEIPGIDTVPHHTSDTVMRLPELPGRMLIVGGGFIAAELAHVFGGLGTDVTIVHRRDVLLGAEDRDVSRAFTDRYAERFDLRMKTVVEGFAMDGGSIVAALAGDRGGELPVDVVLIATGRVPNGDQLNLPATGLSVGEDGYLPTDPFLRTGVEGIWALGDVTNPAQLKHTANEEARVLAHNLIHPDDMREVDLWPTPHAVFASPQVAAVGPTSQELDASGRDYVSSVRPYADTAYGWAMEDRHSFCKVLADPETRLLLGAHIIGPHAPTLLQQLVQGMRFGQTVDQMARGQLWTHPAMPEVVEQALLSL